VQPEAYDKASGDVASNTDAETVSWAWTPGISVDDWRLYNIVIIMAANAYDQFYY
jgi:hypothetical protein